ncbi:MAG: hypothetical protein LBM06_06905 [Prevotellaceae bacterium]|jgi:hypothetical protein|nr:hypothetical protein [Prevotellaceae bacterium]
MADISIQVDTNPMAEKVGTVAGHVNQTTMAVVTMQTAVIAAEQEAANNVCVNVNRGFFTLIRSQISQKIAQKRSEIDSLLLSLNQQRKQFLIVACCMSTKKQPTTFRSVS